MNWILEHFQIVIVIATTIAWWLNQRREANKEVDEAREDVERKERGERRDGGSPWAPVDHEELERTKKIQEDIRRKIAERQGRTATPTPPPVPSRPVTPPVVMSEQARRAERTLRPEPEVPQWGADDNAALERQRRLAERMKELEQAKVQAQRRAEEAGRTVIAEREVSANRAFALEGDVPGGVGGDWLEELQDPARARRAIMLREILDPPVALR